MALGPAVRVTAASQREAPVSGEAVFGLLIPLGVFVVLAAGGLWIAIAVRRRMSASRQSTTAAFSLAELRRLRDRGDLTAEEYDALARTLYQGPSDRAA